MTRRSALSFVKRNGIVLESARGPVPNLAEAVVGGRIRGSWWGHARGKEIFWLTRAVRDSADVLVCRLVGRKITYVHRRLWPALVRLARNFARRRCRKSTPPAASTRSGLYRSLAGCRRRSNAPRGGSPSPTRGRLWGRQANFCADPKVAIAVPDSALTARYRAIVVANKPVFVLLRGMSWAISPKRSDGASGSLASANCRVSRGVRRANPSRPP